MTLEARRKIKDIIDNEIGINYLGMIQGNYSVQMIKDMLVKAILYHGDAELE